MVKPPKHFPPLLHCLSPCMHHCHIPQKSWTVTLYTHTAAHNYADIQTITVSSPGLPPIFAIFTLPTSA